MRDRETNTTRRVSVASDGTQADGESFAPVISRDGRWIAFRSRASNLVPGYVEACAQSDYPDNCSGIFVHDLQTHVTELVVVASDNGGLGIDYRLSISADGRWIAFSSVETNLMAGTRNPGENIFVYDRQMGRIELVSQTSEGIPGNGASQSPAIAADGRWLAFSSSAENLVGTEGQAGTFIYDRQTGKAEYVGPGGMPDISSDGRWVAFSSNANHLVPDDSNECSNPQFGPHNCSDIFVYDGQTLQMERASVAGDGSQSNGESFNPSISADGRFVAFASDAANLVADDTNACRPNRFVATCFDIFVRDRLRGLTERVSVASDGVQANHDSRWPMISADGRWVVFVSRASNLVADDTNELPDVFVHDRQTGQTERISVPGSN